MRVVLLAYHDVGCAGLRALLDGGDEVVALFTHDDDPGEGCWFESIAELARCHDIPTFQPEEINEPTWVERIRAFEPELILSLNYRKLVGRPILEIAPKGAMNLHGSLLPDYRGRCPLNWVLVHGETRTGVTLHYMIERADAGDIVAQRPIEIAPADDALTLHRKIVREAGSLMRDTLPAIRLGTQARRPQRIEEGSYYGRRTADDGSIDWQRGAVEIYNLVRAVTRPFPGARTRLDDRLLFVWRSRPESEDRPGVPPGTLLLDGDPSVATGRGRLRLLECQFEDGPSLEAARFVERYSLCDGTRLV